MGAGYVEADILCAPGVVFVLSFRFKTGGNRSARVPVIFQEQTSNLIRSPIIRFGVNEA